MNSNPGTPFSSAGSRLSLSISGSTFRLGSDADFDELDVGYTEAGIQTFDLNSPPAPGAFHAVRIYAANLALAKSTLYAAIRNANATGGNFPDGIVDLGLHAGSGIGLATVADYILIRPTKVGDLNLDGSVTIADFIALASHFNQAGTWEEGDVNYDGLVTIADFIALASNFNQSYAGESLGVSEAEAQMLSQFAVDHSATVPEAGVGLWMISGAALLRRRSKKRGRG